MTRVLSAIDRLCLLAARTAAVLLALLFLLGISEIVLRAVFRISLPFAVEYSGYLLVLVLFLGSGWTLSQGGHIRVTLIREHISKASARLLDIATTGLALIVSGILTVSLADYALGTWARGTVSYYSSETPLALPQGLLVIGPLVLTLALFARLIRLLRNDDPENSMIAASSDQTDSLGTS